ncbi:hypothetical protein B0H63DRAFT_518085 [Podospora didyma]|uniref:Uncharacterized protein n=1 Tax=Podospora didyma TaxID=330526 RepID=A0AAE0U8K5_9PEZI|nr:hypothetical protein B0H63DRAFT_518085 [Podospora didyma]
MELERRLPVNLKRKKIKFVITTPAIWSSAAQHNTLVAAKNAGFGSRALDIVVPVTEPEAAACYALKDVNSISALDSEAGNDSGWKGILLVGGFGESKWVAVAKGAVCYGMSPQGRVQSRVLPCHYGAVLDQLYSSFVHNSVYHYVDEWFGLTYNRDTMDWFAKMASTTSTFHISALQQYGTFKVNLRTCREDVYTPEESARSNNPSRTAPYHIDLSKLPASTFLEKTRYST